MTHTREPLPHINLRLSSADAVADQLRKELLTSAIPPGSRILPNEIAKRFSVSHTPVREALQRLESERLIVRTPHGATHAADIGLDDLDGVYALRRLIEADLARSAAATRDARDVERVTQAWERLEAATPYDDDFLAAHRAFHWSLLAPAGNPVARRILDTLWIDVDRYVGVAARTLGSARAATDVASMEKEHRALHGAFRRGDAERLGALLVAHLTKTEARLRSALTTLLAPHRS